MDYSDSKRWRNGYVRLLAHPVGIRLRWWTSGVVGFLSDVRWPVFLRPFLWRFLGGAFGVKWEEVEKPLREYASFDSFFTRQLRRGARPVGQAEYLHPADAQITASHPIHSDRLIQAKGAHYSLERFLKDPQALKKYDQGWALTYYLSPKDYHRVHCPVSGVLRRKDSLGRDLWPVNSWAVQRVPDLFIENHRVIFEIESPRGSLSVVMVGALNVGRISSSVSKDQPNLQQGQELGQFHLGSTVVVIASKQWAEVLSQVGLGTSLVFADPLDRRSVTKGT